MTGDLGDLLPLFLEEAGSRLDRLGVLLDTAEDDPGAAVQVRRELHALKGAARMMGLAEVADLCHQAEEHMLGDGGGGIEESKDITEGLAAMLDELREPARRPGRGSRASARRTAKDRKSEIRGGSGELRVATEVIDHLADRSARMRVSAKAGGTLVRQLFSLISDAERRTGDRTDPRVLPELTTSLRRVALELEGTQKTLHQLSEEHLDAVLRIQVQPLRPFLRTLARHARELARSLGKEVKVATSGGDVQLDRRILAAIREVTLHLVRNAVDHGIEDVESRRESGKPAAGRLRLAAEAEGDRVRLVVSDDGRGIDPEQVVGLAVERGVVDPAAATGLTPDEAYQLLYLPGFTTRTLATDVSGRGIGLDAVAASIRNIGGDVWIRSTLGKGTRLTVEVPVTRRGERVLVVRVGGLRLAIPSAAVRSFRRLQPEMILTEEGRVLVRSGDATMGAVFLARLFGETEAHNSILVETAIGGTSTAVVVDDILGEEEVFVRPLPGIAGAPAAVEGIALISSGRPVAVISLQRLGPIDLATSAGSDAAGPPKALRVLLVEDTRVTREMLRRLLEDGGFDVTAASSAEEALERLDADAFDCLVTDIEMPGLSGIELTRRLRASESMSGLPVVVVSTRERPADRLAGLEAGADAYFTKQGLDAEVLVALIRRVGGR